MGILDGLLGNLDDIAGKLGLPADKVQEITSSLTEKLSGDGDKMQAIQDLAAEHGISVDKIKEMLGGDGEGRAAGATVGVKEAEQVAAGAQ